MTTRETSPFWTPAIHTDRRPLLLARNRIRDAVRTNFVESGFVEVECGILQHSPGNEAHLHAFATRAIRPDATTEDYFLHTSPEFACKKLLSAGETRIFELARVFRNRERGPLHAPEFTMLEWYRANESYEVVQKDCLRLLQIAVAQAGTKNLRYRDRPCDPALPAERLSVAEAFSLHAGIELLPTLSASGQGDRDHLATKARRAGFSIADNDSWTDIFSKILVARVEPRLGIEKPTILYEYPRCEAALARATARDARVAERFELYACGVELANGFGELTDPVEQRARFIAEMDEKQRIHGERYPLDEEFLGALSLMPESSGVALGFDRLVMLATGAPRIDDVLWTPLPEWTP